MSGVERGRGACCRGWAWITFRASRPTCTSAAS